MALGEILIDSKTISQEQLEKALQTQSEIGGQLGYILTKLGYTTEDEILGALSAQLQIQTDSLADFTPDASLMDDFPQELLEKNLMLPLRKTGSTLVIGATDPSDFSALDAIRMQSRMSVETVLVPLGRTRELLDQYYANENEEDAQENTAPTPSPSRAPRHLLRSLVRDLEREDDIQTDTRTVSNDLEDLPHRQLLLALLDVLLDKGMVQESDLAAALTARLKNKE